MVSGAEGHPSNSTAAPEAPDTHLRTGAANNGAVEGHPSNSAAVAKESMGVPGITAPGITRNHLGGAKQPRSHAAL